MVPAVGCSGPVRMCIANLEGVNVPPGDMPRLEMSNTEGYVFADPTATGVFLFEENCLEEGTGTREGDYRYPLLTILNL